MSDGQAAGSAIGATVPAADGGDTELASLADWRRRVADLYAEVRGLGDERALAAWTRWVAAREALFRDHPRSPIPVSERSRFRARHWPYDPRLRFHAVVEPEPETEGAGLALPVSDGGTMAFRRIATLEIPFQMGAQRLALYWMSGYAGGLFVPFRDATNGTETYGAGRYLLDAAKSADLGADADGRLVLDFNFAFQPSCAFDPRWACPLAPPENRLDIAIRAGERIA